MKRALVIAGAVAIMAAVLFCILTSGSPFQLVNTAPVHTGSTLLPAAEIRNYEGTDLSSISDFRENSIRGPQQVNISAYQFSVTGQVATPRNYTYDELLSTYPHYAKVVTLHCVEGWDVRILWEGIRVRDIIAAAGPDPSATTVIFRASDGYSTSLPLGYLVDRDILIAYRMNNVTLPAGRGYPFQLVAEDKWGYKWIKWISGIELTDDADYRGYWEQRGYPDSADVRPGMIGK